MDCVELSLTDFDFDWELAGVLLALASWLALVDLVPELALTGLILAEMRMDQTFDMTMVDQTLDLAFVGATRDR